jgi:hypothetical protein
MKKTLLLALLIIASAVSSFSQGVPSGMKYQAVARDADGKVLGLKKVGLEIRLYAGGPDGKLVFEEDHQVMTSVLGLFDVTIGEGVARTGTLEEVNWSAYEIWMEIGLDEDGGQNFKTISTTRLLTVPYAFHAATAGNIVTDLEEKIVFPEPDCSSDPCDCDGAYSEVKVYYFGENAVNIEVYGNSSLTNLITTFTDVNKGDLLTIDGTSTSIGSLYSKTYFRVTNLAGESCITWFRTKCPTNSWPGATDDNRIVGLTFGDFTVFSRTDEETGTECSISDTNQDWHVGGNVVEADNNTMGTRNNQDVNFITNDVTRGILTNDGDLGIFNNVYLNTISGNTINNGDFTVANEKSALFSGTLTADLATDLNASLNVDGPTNLQSSLNVNNNSSTILSGTLLTQDNATFNQQVLLDNASLSSTTVSSGALVVNGGVGIGENLNVGGIAKFGGPVEFGGAVAITDETESTNSSTGALVVSGGVGVQKRLNVDGAAQVNNTLIVETSNVVDIPGGYDADLTSTSNVGTGHIAHFRNSGDGSGILVQVGAGTPQNKNNFLTFINSSGQIVGRIEGESSSADLANNLGYQQDLSFATDDVTLEATALAIVIAEGVMQTIELAGAIGSSTVCVGLIPCVTAPSPGEIAAAVAMEVIAIANIALQAANLAIAETNKQQFISLYMDEIGVTFASGAEDYAEYLPKLNVEVDFAPGEIVGMKNGYISKNTWDADRIMVISHNPAVLGGMPGTGEEHKYEMVAFLGQIPTMVMGRVNSGDYILPTGNGDGLGIAKHPDSMRPEDYKQILGVAWEGSKKGGLNMIKVAIGLNTNDLTDLVNKQNEQIDAQKQKIDEQQEEIESLKDQMTILADLVPGFREAAGIEDTHEGHDHTTGVLAFEPGSIEQQAIDAAETGEIIMIDITRQHFEEGLELARKKLVDAGANLEEHPFWMKIDNDPSYKDSVFKRVKSKMDDTLHYHNDINKRMSQE